MIINPAIYGGGVELVTGRLDYRYDYGYVGENGPTFIPSGSDLTIQAQKGSLFTIYGTYENVNGGLSLIGKASGVFHCFEVTGDFEVIGGGIS